MTDYTYKSKQATKCAVCGNHKHTPLRRDEMGGYVCLTCIDTALDTQMEMLALRRANQSQKERLEKIARQFHDIAYEDLTKAERKIVMYLSHQLKLVDGIVTKR